MLKVEQYKCKKVKAVWFKLYWSQCYGWSSNITEASKDSNYFRHNYKFVVKIRNLVLLIVMILILVIITIITQLIIIIKMLWCNVNGNGNFIGNYSTI